MLQEFCGNADDGRLRNGDSQVAQEDGGDPFVDQNPAVLGIVEELDHVGMPVRGFDQMCLRAPAHLPDQAARVDGH